MKKSEKAKAFKAAQIILGCFCLVPNRGHLSFPTGQLGGYLFSWRPTCVSIHLTTFLSSLSSQRIPFSATAKTEVARSPRPNVTSTKLSPFRSPKIALRPTSGRGSEGAERPENKTKAGEDYPQSLSHHSGGYDKKCGAFYV